MPEERLCKQAFFRRSARQLAHRDDLLGHGYLPASWKVSYSLMNRHFKMPMHGQRISFPQNPAHRRNRNGDREQKSQGDLGRNCYES